MRGHGPRSNASLAAATARLTSASCASATLRNSSSVAQLITLIFEAPEGAAHSPSMKKRPGCLTGEVVGIALICYLLILVDILSPDSGEINFHRRRAQYSPASDSGSTRVSRRQHQSVYIRCRLNEA